ncbi:MAG: hypothetical protein WKF77_20065 [Planctomycetaceae bacterium]
MVHQKLYNPYRFSHTMDMPFAGGHKRRTTEGVGSLFLPITVTVTLFQRTVPTQAPQKKIPDPFDAVILLPEIDASFTLAEVYARVKFEPIIEETKSPWYVPFAAPCNVSCERRQ